MQTVIELISLRNDLLDVCKGQRDEIIRLKAECLANKTNMEEARNKERVVSQKYNDLQSVIIERDKLIEEYKLTINKAVEIIQSYKEGYKSVLRINDELLEMNKSLQERIKELEE